MSCELGLCCENCHVEDIRFKYLDMFNKKSINLINQNYYIAILLCKHVIRKEKKNIINFLNENRLTHALYQRCFEVINHGYLYKHNEITICESMVRIYNSCNSDWSAIIDSKVKLGTVIRFNSDESNDHLAFQNKIIEHLRTKCQKLFTFEWQHLNSKVVFEPKCNSYYILSNITI
jgi:hypothetical protein